MPRCPFAEWKPLSGPSGSHNGGPFKIVHHTTEGSTAEGAMRAFQAQRSDPHFTVDATRIYQHVDTAFGARALRNAAGGVETNRDSAIQIELVGFAHLPKDPRGLTNVARLCRWIESVHGVPREWPAGLPRPAKNGRDPGRHNRDPQIWDRCSGHYGHCHVPENTHWDPAYSAAEVAFLMEATFAASGSLVSPTRPPTAARGRPGRRAPARRPVSTMPDHDDVGANLSRSAAPGGLVGPLSTEPAAWNRLVVGRARQHRVEIRIANCSITQINARAYALGLFREVNPAGAANYVDKRLDGVVTEFMRRRMYSGGVGEVFILPTNRSRLAADLVLFAGLGYFDRFNAEVLETTAENVLRTFVRTRVEDFATVVFGGGSGIDIETLLASLVKGFVRGKLDADVDHHFRRVTICELDRMRYQEIRTKLYDLACTPLFEDVEITFTELPPPVPEEALVEAPSERARVLRLDDPVYLIVRREREANGRLVFGSSLLTAGAKASIVTDERAVSAKALEAQLAKTGADGFRRDDARRLGSFLAENVLAESIHRILLTNRDRHLVVVHDAPSSRIPWETLKLGDWEPALGAASGDENRRGGMSRRYMAENLSVAKYLEQRPPGAKLRLLLVVNPTGDLEGARKEGESVAALFRSRTDVEVVRLEERAATRARLLHELSSGSYDLVHYAGHASFDPEVTERSGLLCHGGVPLTGTDLSAIGNLPKLVFFNACESGRTRRRGGRKPESRRTPAEIRRERVAPAEAFLRGGIANFLGTYWPVGDAAAQVFSEAFYPQLLAGKPIGTAILAGRRAIHDNEKASPDWSDYIHYGDFGFVLT